MQLGSRGLATRQSSSRPYPARRRSPASGHSSARKSRGSPPQPPPPPPLPQSDYMDYGASVPSAALAASPPAAPQAAGDQNAYVPLQQVEELLKQRQLDMAKKMDDYYQQRMKQVYSDAKAETHDDAQKLAQAQKEAIQAAKMVKSQHDADLQNHAQERARWKAEKERLHEEAEKGYQELYTSIHTSHREAIVKLETELQRVKEKAQQDRDMYEDRVAKMQQDVEERRRNHELQLQRRCDALVQQYRKIAEEATTQAAQQHQAHQFEMMELMKKEAAERKIFEKQVMASADNIIKASKDEVKNTLLKLEQEREKFARFEVEVRRQFEAHCRNFENRIRKKAASLLANKSSPSERGAATTFTTVLSSPDANSVRPSSASPNSAQDADKVRKTVAELKSYMSSLRGAASPVDAALGATSVANRSNSLVAASNVPLMTSASLSPLQQHHQSQQRASDSIESVTPTSVPRRGTMVLAKSTPISSESLPPRRAPPSAPAHQSSGERKSPGANALVDALVDFSSEETSRMMASLNALQ